MTTSYDISLYTYLHRARTLDDNEHHLTYEFDLSASRTSDPLQRAPIKHRLMESLLLEKASSGKSRCITLLFSQRDVSDGNIAVLDVFTTDEQDALAVIALAKQQGYEVLSGCTRNRIFHIVHIVRIDETRPIASFASLVGDPERSSEPMAAKSQASVAPAASSGKANPAKGNRSAPEASGTPSIQPSGKKHRHRAGRRHRRKAKRTNQP